MTFYLAGKFKNAKAFYAKLGKHKKSKACLYMIKLDDSDLDVLKEIISFEYEQENLAGC